MLPTPRHSAAAQAANNLALIDDIYAVAGMPRRGATLVRLASMVPAAFRSLKVPDPGLCDYEIVSTWACGCT